MIYSLSLEVDVEDAGKLYNVLTSEEPVTNDRAEFDIKKEDGKVIYDVRAKDATALRAILNSITTNLQIYEKTSKIEN